jgi:C4-type Zn-finger protein
MERKMGSRELIRSGSVEEGGSGQVVSPLPLSEQLCRRSCARCGGLLVNEWYYGSNHTDALNVESLRCVQCGYRVDPVILQNQTRPSVERKGVRQGQPKSSAKAAVLSEVA